MVGAGAAVGVGAMWVAAKGLGWTYGAFTASLRINQIISELKSTSTTWGIATNLDEIMKGEDGDQEGLNAIARESLKR